jgi:hypothetical protein
MQLFVQCVYFDISNSTNSKSHIDYGHTIDNSILMTVLITGFESVTFWLPASSAYLVTHMLTTLLSLSCNFILMPYFAVF